MLGDHLKEPKRAWKRVLDRAGIDDLRIHDLRRTLGSYLAMNGESQYVIGQMLGHKDPRSTAVYARLDLTTVRRAAEAVGEKWQNLLAIDSQAALPALQVAETKPPAERGRQAKNASVKITGADQVIVEGKILTVLRAGGNTKKSFYSKIGSLVQVNGSEMKRILAEMVDRQLITAKSDDTGTWRYTLA